MALAWLAESRLSPEAQDGAPSGQEAQTERGQFRPATVAQSTALVCK